MSLPVARILDALRRRRGALAVLDQAVVSGASLAAIVALGRFAGAEALGRYALAMTVLTLAATALRALLVTPYAVFVARATPDQRRAMRAVLVGGGAVACLGLLVGSALVALADPAWAGGKAFVLAVGAAAGGWALRDLARMTAYADLAFGRALAVDVAVSVLIVVGLGALAWTDEMTGLHAVVVVGAAGGVGGLAGLVGIVRDALGGRDGWRREAARMMGFGGWGVLSQGASVLQGSALPWALAATVGVEAAGVYAALWAVAQLAGPLVQAAGNALTPELAARAADGGGAAVARVARRVAGGAAAAGTVYLGVLVVGGATLAGWVYGPTFAGGGVTLSLLAATVAVSAVSLPASKGVVVLERPDLHVALNVAVLGLTVGLAAGLGASAGLPGAAAGLLLATAVGAAAKWAVFERVARGRVSRATAQVEGA